MCCKFPPLQAGADIGFTGGGACVFDNTTLRFSIKEALCLKDCFNPCIC